MIEKARNFATRAHAGQKRKSSDSDYIVHPVQVAETLKEAGYRDEVVCAGYLHDVVEDTNYDLADIEKEFGPVVRNLVSIHTEDKSDTWQVRKQHTIEIVKNGHEEVKALIVADKLDNLRSLKTGLDQQGEALWKHFNAGFEKQKWYNKSIAEVMETGIPKQKVPAFFGEYHSLIKQTFD